MNIYTYWQYYTSCNKLENDVQLFLCFSLGWGLANFNIGLGYFQKSIPLALFGLLRTDQNKVVDKIIHM